MEGNRAEAERWLYTANKLLNARDLHGARSFAIRARESDPRFDATELLLTVIDTLLAGQVRIKDHHMDYYSILQVLRYTHNFDFIAAQYRRLATLLDPHRNPFAFAPHAFSLVHDAWSILSNPSRKALYDDQLRLLTQPPPPPPPPPPRPPSPPPRPPSPPPPPQIHFNQNHTQNQNHQQLKSPRPIEARVVAEEHNNKNNNNDTNIDGDSPSHDNVGTEPTRARPVDIEGPSFWTACPYCYVMYEYPKEYVECTLRCHSCQRGFHAMVIRSPPPLTGDGGGYFCSYGFIPLGFSGNFKDINGSSSEWNPFSALFPCPVNGASSNNKESRKGQWVFYDEEEEAAFVELSDTTEDDTDDEDWRGGKGMGGKSGRRRRRRRRRGSFASSVGIERPRRGIHNGGAAAAGNGNDDNVGNGEAVDDGGSVPAKMASAAARTEPSKKAVLGGSRRRGAGNLGKLDLNVEFSNEVEEHAPGGGVRERNENGTGNAEDNIEGIGFFEGLDEFLSSLPILNVVADDKVKGH